MSDSQAGKNVVGPPDENADGEVRSTGTDQGRPTPQLPTLGLTADELARSVAPMVLDTPGVASLVPTMATALDRLRLHRGQTARKAKTATRVGRARDGHAASSGDGIAVTVKDDTVTVVIDITVTSTTSVLSTAVAVRSTAARVIQAAHPGRFTVTVNVLDRDPIPIDTDTPTPIPAAPTPVETARSR